MLHWCIILLIFLCTGIDNVTLHSMVLACLQEDVFDLEQFYVGKLRKISIGHDRTELGKTLLVETRSVQLRATDSPGAATCTHLAQ